MANPGDGRLNGWWVLSALGVLAGYWVYCRCAETGWSWALPFYWLTVFAMLLMLISLVIPLVPFGNRSAAAGCWLGFLLFGVAFLGLVLTERFLSPRSCLYLTLGNYAVFYTGFALLLNCLFRRLAPYAGLLIAFLAFDLLPVLVTSHQNCNWAMFPRPPWMTWASPFCVDFYDYWFVFRVSIWLALAGIGLALPSMIVWFRLKKE